jgi:hypothetical protein
MSEHKGKTLSAEEQQQRLREQYQAGVRIVGLVNAVAQGNDAKVWIGGLLIATAHLLRTWAEPGSEAAMLISGSDYLTNTAAQYAVEKPQ